MIRKDEVRKIVIVNQATNYLTIGLCNSFIRRFKDVSLITGKIHTQGEMLNDKVEITYINKYFNSPPHKKLFSYILACLKIYMLLKTKYKKHEVLFISLPPMGYLLNILLPNKFSMIIWDIYPDVFKITGMSNKNLIYKTWANLNRRSFRKAFRIFTIGQIMAETLSKYIDWENIIIQPIWSVFQDKSTISKSENPFIKTHNLIDKFVVQYSGNIGLTHKVEAVVQIAELLTNESNIIFQIIGRGPRVAFLKKVVEEKKLPNCFFLPFQTDEMFPFSLSAADLGVVILDETTSNGSVPSKSYNLMSFGIPSLYICSNDSELSSYAIKFGHAKCFSSSELLKARDFILEIYNNHSLWNDMSRKALEASQNFKRRNADKFVEKYLSN